MPPRIGIEGQLNAGEFSGEAIFRRTIAKNADTGEVLVGHTSFHLPDSLQKQGLGVEEFTRRVVEAMGDQFFNHAARITAEPAA